MTKFRKVGGIGGINDKLLKDAQKKIPEGILEESQKESMMQFRA